MSKRFDNKNLIYVLGILVIILVLTFILKVPGEKATIKSTLVSFDTLAVSKIDIIPRNTAGKPFEFNKQNNIWSVRQGNIISKPADGAVQNIFNEILSLKPQSLAAVKESKWNEFDLTDSLATRIKFLNSKGRVLADLLLGKFSYKQVTNRSGYPGGNNVEGISYVRLNGHKEVYGVDGFLAFSISGKFSDWRDKSLIRCRKQDILKVTFTFPGDSSYTLSKKDSDWFAGDQKADSTAVSNYFNLVGNINGVDISDDFNPVSNPDYQISIEGNNLLNTSLKCFTTAGKDDYILNSNLNPEVFFTSKKSGTFSQIFKPKKYFVKKQDKI
jgi:hypothetical protein